MSVSGQCCDLDKVVLSILISNFTSEERINFHRKILVIYCSSSRCTVEPELWIGITRVLSSRFMQNEAMCLTPLPRSKCMLNSPRRRVSYNRDVFVSPLKAGSYPVSPKHHTYHFNQSPAKVKFALSSLTESLSIA